MKSDKEKKPRKEERPIHAVREHSSDDASSRSSSEDSHEHRRRHRKNRKRRKKKKKHKLRKYESSSDDDSYERPRKRHRSKAKRKLHSEDRKRKGEPRVSSSARAPEISSLSVEVNDKLVAAAVAQPPSPQVNIEVSQRAKSMVPMTREQYEAQMSVIREVYDEETGRTRLMRGTGEIIERIVSRSDHGLINQQATRGDGSSYTRHIFSATRSRHR